MNNAVKHLYAFGPFRLDPAQRRLRRGEDYLDLPPRVFDTLVALTENDGQLLEKDELMRRIWPDAVVEENNLTQAIYLLRKVLRDGENGDRYIETVPKRGYRFVASVREVSPDSDSDFHPAGAAAEERVVPALAAVTLPVAPAASSARSHWSGGRLAQALVFLAAALIALLLVQSLSSHRSGNQPSSHTLAVLPLQNLSKDPGQDYFVDGFTEELVTDIAQIRSLRVISRTSTTAYTGTHKSLPEIARELHADLVLEGSIVRDGDRVRVTAQLINAPTDTHLWARTYDADVKDILDIQSQISRAIADDIRLDLSPQEKQRLASVPAVNPEAYDLYLRGRYAFQRRNIEAFHQAMGYYQQAVTRDPQFALGYTGLADCYTLLALFGDGYRWVPDAVANARHALAIDDSLAEAHRSLAAASVLDWQWARAEQEFHRTLELSPNDAQAHQWYGNLFLGPMGRHAEAIAELRRALDLDPLSLVINTDLGYAYFLNGDYDATFQQYQKVLAMDSSFVPVHYYLSQYYEERGQHDQAVGELVQDATLVGRPATANAIRKLAANRIAFYSTMAETQGSFIPGKPTGVAVNSAHAFLALGEKEKAIAALQKSVAAKETEMIYLKVEPTWNPLHGDLQFRDLERTVGLLPR